eukprot:5257485-Prymnesium_polylepis.1
MGAESIAGAGIAGDAFRGANQAAAAAATRLACDTPEEVGELQRISSAYLLRPYPHGLRFSGANAEPRPAWLVGAHSVALNKSNVDLPLQLHYALFNKTDGYVLKPPEMLSRGLLRVSKDDHGLSDLGLAHSWPPQRERLHCVSISDPTLTHTLPEIAR